MTVPNDSIASDGGWITLKSGGSTDWRLFVSKLSTQDEIRLSRELGQLAKAAMGPGGYFAETRGLLDWLKANKLVAEFEIATTRLIEMEARKVLPSIDEFRQTPEGLVVELFHRTRKAHAEIKIDELRAIITTINAIDVYSQMMEAISDDHKST